MEKGCPKKAIDNGKTRANWDAASDAYYAGAYEHTETLTLLKKNPARGFPTKVYENIRRYFPDLAGVKVCVPSSGDNIAAFAFHLLGADVTSCDLSPEQIKNAKKIAAAQGWDIDFKVCDSMNLYGVDSAKYDFVYTSNGAHVWISDLSAMYRNFHRVLKDGGIFLFFETHPFIRPFDDSTNELKVKHPYSNVGPFGEVPNYLWRVQDFVNALAENGFHLLRMNELPAEKSTLGANWWKLSEWDEQSDWNRNPYAALPQWLSIAAEK